MTQPPSGPRRDRGGERAQRRMPPPDATGREAEYFLDLKEAGTLVVSEMIDGTVFRGHVEYYDREMIKINRPATVGPGVFVRKKHVRCLYEDKG